ncbi:MAG: glycosyltransferase [Steroidobacter sp.]
MSKDVLILCSNAYWPSIGGIENSLRHLAGEARKSNLRVLIVASDIGVNVKDPEHLASWKEGVRVIRYPMTPIKFRCLKPVNFLLSILILRRLFRRLKRMSPGATIVARHHFLVLAAVAAGFQGVRYLVPSIAVQQELAERASRRGLFKVVRSRAYVALHSLLQRLALQCSTVFVFSRTMATQCAHLSGKNLQDISVVKPGVDPARFHPLEASLKVSLKKKLSLPVDRKLALFVGRFVHAKGVDLLLESIAAKSSSYDVVLVGRGTELENYLALIKNRSLQKNVFIFPNTPSVEEYFQAADVFVMCSRYEPFGQTVLEALCSGLPVVAFRGASGVVTATEELGMDDYIVYASNLSAESLSAAISECIKKQFWDASAISIACHTTYNWRRLLDDLMDG